MCSCDRNQLGALCELGAMATFSGGIGAGTGYLMAPALGMASAGGAIFGGIFSASILPAVYLGTCVGICGTTGPCAPRVGTADIIWLIASLFAATVVAPAVTVLAGHNLTFSAAVIIGGVGIISTLATLVITLLVICNCCCRCRA